MLRAAGDGLEGSGIMYSNNADIARATAVQAKYAEELMALPNVVGVAVGLIQRGGNYSDEVGLVVMVEQKLPEAQLTPETTIPRELDGVPVDVQETGPFISEEEDAD